MQMVCSSVSARYLFVVLESVTSDISLKLNKQVNLVVKNSFFQLRMPAKIKIKLIFGKKSLMPSYFHAWTLASHYTTVPVLPFFLVCKSCKMWQQNLEWDSLKSQAHYQFWPNFIGCL